MQHQIMLKKFQMMTRQFQPNKKITSTFLMMKKSQGRITTFRCPHTKNYSTHTQKINKEVEKKTIVTSLI